MQISFDYSPNHVEQKAAILKAHRTAIRAKFSLLGDHEIRRTSEELDKQISEAIQAGKDFTLLVADVYRLYGPDQLGEGNTSKEIA